MAKKPALARTPPALSREKIAEVALTVLREHGVEGFSLREVARSLNVYPTALYWHVRSKNELLAAACGLAMRDIVPDTKDNDWKTWLRQLFQRYRQVMQSNPHLAQLVGAQVLSNASLDLHLIERILEVLEKAGCPPNRIGPLYNCVIAAMCGFPTLEFAQLPAEDAQGWASDLQARVNAVPAADYPVLASHLPSLANRSFILRWETGHDMPLEQSFDAWTDIFLAGLEHMIAAPSQTPPRP